MCLASGVLTSGGQLLDLVLLESAIAGHVCAWACLQMLDERLHTALVAHPSEVVPRNHELFPDGRDLDAFDARGIVVAALG